MSKDCKHKKLAFAVVTACTSVNLLLGFGAVYLATEGQLLWAAWAIIFSVLFDACDGFLARRWGVASEFGAQMDSLGDFSGFCVGAAVLALCWCRETAPLALCFPCAAVFMLCGGMRLARYNSTVDSLCPPSFFEGVPTTGAACMLAGLYILFPEVPGLYASIITAVLGLLMVCRLPYPKVTKMTAVPKWCWLLIPVAALLSLHWTFAVLSAAYLLSGPAFAFILKRPVSPEE